MKNTIKKILIVGTILFSLAILWGCQEPEVPPTTSDEHPFAGNYVLVNKIISDIDVTNQSVYGTLELDLLGNAKMITLDMYGLDVQEGTYTYTDLAVNVTIGIRKYTFDYHQDDETLTYEGKINRKEVLMSYQKDQTFKKPETKGGVPFTDRLFGESLDENFYNYAPSIMMEGNSIMHIWYCGNKESGNVTDYIVYRRGMLQGDGTWKFTEKELVLSPTAGTWDERHVCDPSVIKGLFNYKGIEYNYIMSYLGCITNDSSRNEVGIAVAQSVEGPWVKVDELNPIANYYESAEYTNDFWTWGYGQPSLVSVDQSGKVLLFYSKGVVSGTYEYVELWDFSDLDNPLKLEESQISNAGVVNAAGSTDVINNADFAYDAQNKRLYVIKEDFPYATGGGLDWLTGDNTLMYMNLEENEDYVGQTLFSGKSLRWQVIKSVGTEDTGYARVHNAGIITNEFGWLINSNQIPIVYTSSDLANDYPDWKLKGQWPALHTYRLNGLLIEV